MENKTSAYLKWVKNFDFSDGTCLSSTTPGLPNLLPDNLFWEKKESRDTKHLQEVRQKLENLNSISGSHSICASIGATQAVFQVIMTVCSPNSSVIIETPYYEPFVQIFNSLAIKPIFFKRSQNSENDIKEISKIIENNNPSAILLTNPNFFEGTLYDNDTLEKIAGLGLPTIVDEVCLPLFGSEKITSYNSTSSKNLIFVSSLSKSIGLSSLRIGWIISHSKISKKIEDYGLLLHTDIPTLNLIAASFVFDQWDKIIKLQNKTIERNRQTLRRFQKIKTLLNRPIETGHIFSLSTPSCFQTMSELTDVLEKKRIFLTSGHWFGAEDRARLTLLADPEKFEQSLIYLEKVIQ